ncbi:MAG TPA: ABC transporter ATP-binding protein [Candidatus Dormibacteraeota bacterium]|nr:ABC transporter ATP-binding protein [Candidatus Dormibacteraeota bacterium]
MEPAAGAWPTIALEGLRKVYGTRVAVEGLTLSVGAGELFGFIGPNGAGKTTTIKMAVGLLQPSAGRVCIGGHDAHRDGLAARRVTGYVPDTAALYEKLTGWETLELAADLHGVPVRQRRARMEAALHSFELDEVAGELVQAYSRGMRQKLALCAALIHDPLVLFLDEPTVGLDPRSARQLKDALRGLCREGRTVFLSTHVLEVAAALCDRVGVLDGGRLVACGTVSELQALAADGRGAPVDLEAAFLALTGEGSGDLAGLLAALER